VNRIRLLPEQVANQIAAGEVVERPASVVKELVENALDAEATRVTVEIQAGGRSLVRVTDDGVGMSRDDALLSLERHATSKIRRAEDLAAIATMGFRGEALPSIASVSRFTLTTRERDSSSPEGTQIIVNGGKMIEVKAAGAAPGTIVEVRQLFSNLPARRKFLRTEETEAGHVQHYLTLAALAHPEVSFTYVRDGRSIWQLPAINRGAEPQHRIEALQERFRSLQGGDQKLIRVDFSSELPSAASDSPSDDERFETAIPAQLSSSSSSSFSSSSAPDEGGSSPPPPVTRHPSLRVWGLIGAPGVSRSTREDQHLFVNRRPVENRGLNFALLEGYHTSLMKGRYPVCCLFLEIDPAAVDVNIHPAKREVKFHREADVRRFVAQAVRDALLAYGRGQESEVRGQRAEVRNQIPESKAQTADVQSALPNFPPALKPATEPPQTTPAQPSLRMGFAQPVPPATPAAPDLPPPIPHSALPAAPKSDAGGRTPHSPAPVPLLNVPLRLVGVIARLYVVLESDRGLVLLDQHAAHERILFEQMLNRLEQNDQAPSQRLLLPETVELSARDAAFLRGQLATLTRLGVGLGPFGERTFLLDALPPFVKASNPRKFVLELIDELKAAGQEVNSARLGEHTVAKTVCRHAVKANDPLAGRELENLVEDLRRCAMPYTCPHGRPTIIEMNLRELEKKFGRSQ
jgi:DNA mismatch repair protein MutL